MAKPFSPEHLARDFGADAEPARGGIRALYEAISSTTHAKAQTLFGQWKILFGEVCGYDVDNPSEKVRKLAEFYGVEHREGLKPAELLFAVHTYYAIFMKLLASEVVAFFHKLPTPLQKMTQATTSNRLRREMEDLEAGSIFRHLNITNFLEGDLFAWYTFVWDEQIERLARAMAARLDDYNPGTLSEDPAGSRDLLKKLYQQLFPKSVRHDLGEYYTPDWLAEHVLSELGYKGDPDKRLLDPSCGSGTFLVMAINHVRAWYERNRERVPFNEGELCRKILANVIGFDLNPLAVMAARTNYLIAIRDLIGHVDRVEIPVHLCDPIMTLATQGGSTVFAPLFAGQVDFVAGNPPWVRWGFLPSEYRKDTVHLWQEYGLFTKKGIESKMGTAELDLSMLFTYVSADAFLKASGARLGFVITREVFKSKGAGEGFRRFGTPARNLLLNPYRVDDLSSLRPFHAANKTSCLFLTKGQPASYPVPYYVWSKKDAADVSETEMSVEEAGRYLERSKQLARPVGEPGSAWQTMASETTSILDKFAGTSEHKARIGARVEPYGVYWADIVSASDPSRPLIVNLPELGKTAIDKIAPRSVEAEFLFPALRGRDIGRWTFRQKVWIFVLNRSTKREGWVDEKVMRIRWPLTYEYLNEFKGLLLSRANYWKFFGKPLISTRPLEDEVEGRHIRLVTETNGHYEYEIAEAPFYNMFNIGPYTFSPFRVCWSRMTNTIKACVISELATGLGMKPIIPTDTATIVPFDDADEAHHFCAVVNSSPFRWYVQSFSSAGRGFGSAAILQRVRVDTFSRKNSVHGKLAALSQACHAAAGEDDSGTVGRLEVEIDRTAATLWNIDDAELETIRQALS